LSQTANAAFTFGAQAPGNMIPEDLMKRWSWGGFLLGWLWVFWNGNTTMKWINVGCIVFGFFTAGIPGLAFAIFCGIKGNRIAARDRSFASTAEYVAVQRAWAKAGVIILIVSIGLGLILGIVSVIFAGIAASMHHYS
jgi:hypothetical protein